MSYKNRYDTYLNANLQNLDVSSRIGLLNIHTLPQDNESSNLNEINMGVENGDVNGGYCYINSSTGSESNNHNSIYSTKIRDKTSPNISEMENNRLPDGVGIDIMLPEYTLNKYDNMKYNN